MAESTAAISNEFIRLTLGVRDLLDDTADPFLPDVAGRQINASLEVRAGNTIIIGGLRESERPTWGIEHRVPLLGDIPYVGAFFAKSEREERVGLIIMITPRILGREGP